MKILHLPYNIANFASINVQELNKIDGVSAKGIIFQSPNKYHSNEFLVFFPGGNSVFTIRNFFVLLHYLFWADVIHWYWDDKILPKNLTLFLIKFFKKKCFVEWLGEEIRIPEIEAKNNEFYKQFTDTYRSNHFEDKKQLSIELQERFSKAGFYPIICPDMESYLQKKLFKRIFILRQRVSLPHSFTSKPKINNSRFTISHNPSRKGIKGTKFVEAAIENLKKKGYKFNFNLVHGKTHSESLKTIRNSNLFLDQFILGVYGMATLEALSMGVPTVCFISDFNKALYPNELPIINANPSNLESILESILNNEFDLQDISIRSKEYVQKYHESSKLTSELLRIYNTI